MNLHKGHTQRHLNRHMTSVCLSEVFPEEIPYIHGYIHKKFDKLTGKEVLQLYDLSHFAIR